jgi:hypothetical protein
LAISPDVASVRDSVPADGRRRAFRSDIDSFPQQTPVLRDGEQAVPRPREADHGSI